MSKWNHTTLNDICMPDKGAIISGPFGSNISSKYFVSEGVPVIRGNNLSLSLDKFSDEGFVFVTEEKAAELNCYAIEGDLIFTAAGTIGQVGILELPLKYEKYVISNKQLRARIDTSKVHNLYAYYWFSSNWMQNYFIKNNKGSTVPLITLSELKDSPIAYPVEVTEQIKIVEVIEAISKKISNNNRINDNLEQQAKLLYDYWFTQFDFPDENGKPYRSSGGEMVWNEELKREIPKGWGNCKLKDYANNVTRTTIPGEHLKEFFYTPIDEIPKQQMSFYGGLPYTEANSSLQLYEENDILLGAMRVYFHRVCIAAQKGITRTTTMILKPCEDELLAFVYEIFNHTRTIQYANKISVGTQQPYVNWENSLDSMDVIAPDRSVTLAFCEFVNPIIDTIKAKVQENHELAKLRDWLLPMLMNGQATVE